MASTEFIWTEKHLYNLKYYLGNGTTSYSENIGAIGVTKVKFYVYIFCSVCLGQINVKSAEPIRPKFCLRPYMTPGNVYEPSKFKKRVFLCCWKCTNSNIKICKLSFCHKLKLSNPLFFETWCQTWAFWCNRIKFWNMEDLRHRVEQTKGF